MSAQRGDPFGAVGHEVHAVVLSFLAGTEAAASAALVSRRWRRAAGGASLLWRRALESEFPARAAARDGAETPREAYRRLAVARAARRVEWSAGPAAPLPVEAEGHAAVLVGGALLVVGGWFDQFGPSVAVLRADLAAGAPGPAGWSQLPTRGRPPPRRYGHTATHLGGGRVLVAGGMRGGGYTHPTGSWAVLQLDGDRPAVWLTPDDLARGGADPVRHALAAEAARAEAAGWELEDGGAEAGADPYAEGDDSDPGALHARGFHAAAFTPAAALGPGLAARHPAGLVTVVGGNDRQQRPVLDVQLLDVATWTWETAAAPRGVSGEAEGEEEKVAAAAPSPRNGCSATAVGGARVVVAGGGTGGDQPRGGEDLADAWVFSLRDRSWERLPPPPARPRPLYLGRSHGAVEWDGTVFFFGGSSALVNTCGALHLGPETGGAARWSLPDAGPGGAPRGRQAHTLTALGSGEAVLTGGYCFRSGASNTVERVRVRPFGAAAGGGAGAGAAPAAGHVPVMSDTDAANTHRLFARPRGFGGGGGQPAAGSLMAMLLQQLAGHPFVGEDEDWDDEGGSDDDEEDEEDDDDMLHLFGGVGR